MDWVNTEFEDHDSQGFTPFGECLHFRTFKLLGSTMVPSLQHIWFCCRTRTRKEVEVGAIEGKAGDRSEIYRTGTRLTA
jgi:hypothetical protein